MGGRSRPLFQYFRFFNTVNSIHKFSRWMDLNRGPLVSEATAIPTESQPLVDIFHIFFFFVWFKKTFAGVTQKSVTPLFRLKRFPGKKLLNFDCSVYLIFSFQYLLFSPTAKSMIYFWGKLPLPYLWLKPSMHCELIW